MEFRQQLYKNGLPVDEVGRPIDKANTYISALKKVPKIIQVLNWKSLIRQLTARNGDMFNMNLLCPELILAATAVCQLIMIVIRLGCTLRSPIITQ